jgi:anion-transporting  ArsA/GET3 family ATPase
VNSSGLLDPRLLIVTGKGGVGKSTVAATLGLAGARTGRRTCLVEIESRQTMARLFGTQAWDFQEREFRPGLFGISVDAEHSLRQYLDMFYGAKRFSRLIAGSSAAEFATTAAPGLKDVLLLGKVKEVENRRDPDGRLHYDLVVLDAPPSGRIVNFLQAPEATTDLVPVGPIRHQAQMLVDLLLDPRRTTVHIVTLLEEMPVQETVESVAALRELGVSVGPVVVNRVIEERFDREARKAFEELTAPELAAVLAGAGIDAEDAAAAALRDIGGQHLRRLELQERMREELVGRIPLSVLELPFVYADAFGADEIGRLADVIEERAA